MYIMLIPAPTSFSLRGSENQEGCGGRARLGLTATTCSAPPPDDPLAILTPAVELIS